MAEKCFYFVEGKCEKQLINALQQPPGKLIPGRVKVFNIIQELIPISILVTIQSGSKVALVFDTDKADTEKLEENIKRILCYCKNIKILYLPQVRNFEDELLRCTDVRSVIELTHSRSLSNFKNDFCNLKPSDCRHLLERHHINADLLWSAAVPSEFRFIEHNCDGVKTK